MKIESAEDLRQFGCFEPFTSQEKEDIYPLLRAVNYPAEAFVYREKQKVNKIYLVQSGTLKMLKYPLDHVKPLYLGQLFEGDVFAFGEAFFDEYYITVVCNTNCVLLELDVKEFHRLRHEIPAFQEYVMYGLAHIVRGQFFNLERMDAENQMKYLLYYYATLDAEINQDEVIIQPPVNQIQMAERLNITREHVSRIFRALKSQGILIQNQPRIILSRKWFEERKDDPDYDESLHRYYRID